MGRGNRGGGGGRGGGGRGRSRGGRGGGGRGKRQHTDNNDARHIRQFGEAHPSQELGDFGGGDGGPSSNKRGNFRGNFRGQARGRGRGGGGNRGGFNSRKSDSDSSGESDAEELTPYNELLSIFNKKKGNAPVGEVQIVSDEEEEEDDDDGNVDDADLVEETEMTEGIENKNDEDEDNESGLDSSVDAEESSEDENEGDLVEPSKKAARKSVSADKDDKIEDDDDDETEPVEEDEEAEIDPEVDEEDELDDIEDPFLSHFEREMPEILLAQLKAGKSMKQQISYEWPTMEKFKFIGLDAKMVNEEIQREKEILSNKIDLSAVGRSKPVLLTNLPETPPSSKNISLESFSIKPQICSKFPLVNQKVIDDELCTSPLSPLQAEILQVASQYVDAYLPIRTIENSEALRNVYCLHAANHILKTRTRVLHHNAKMSNRIDVPDSYRDQGFVRPKVLILLPFKESAYKVVSILLSLFLEEEKGNVANKKRFVEEYSGSTLFLPKTNPKPDDYNAIFDGNVEDNFKIGISLTKKTVKLFTGFYAADIIIASPLGLRLIVGAEGEKDRDYDFLSSIELLIMDQADLFLMQNWDHVLHLMKHMHLQPVTTHGTDFARIRPWTVDGLNKYYCQTLVFSSIFSPEHSAIMSKYCNNYAGQIRVPKSFSRGSILDVTVQLPQVFQFFESTSLQNADDERFEFFIKKVLPNFTEKLMSHTMIFVSSYFDFVRLRNHFKREQSSFVQICEYTKDKKVARARDYFFHGQGHFLLYTERVHFFRRFRLKGIGHILFYQLPQFPHFYSELCNTIREDFQSRKVRQRKNCSVNVLYCQYDVPRLAAIVGSERASQMLSSEKNVHAFVSGEL